MADGLGDGELLLLENVRFNPGETSKDDGERVEFARALAELTGGADGAADGPGGAFVEDAFGAVHRKHASVYDVARLLPHYCGDLVRDELAVLSRLTGDSAARPYVVVLGGSKVSDKLAVIESLLPKVDRLLVGGGMCFTFLAAQGHEVGDSLLERDQIDTCRRFLDDAGRQDRPADRHRGRRRTSAPTPRPGPSRPTRSPPAARASTSGPNRCARSADALAGAQHRVLERPDGRLRGRAVRRRHARRRAGRRRCTPVCRSSAAAIRPPPCGRSAWTRTRSGTSPPAAARRWSTSRARSFPALPFWKKSDVADHPRAPLPPSGRRPLDRRQLEDELHAPRGDRADPEAGVRSEPGAARRCRGRRAAAVHQPAQRADADRRRPGAGCATARRISRRSTPARTPATSAA